MKMFTLDNVFTIVCNFKNTRSGFKHVATILKNGWEVFETKICYLNRTWEVFEYESVLYRAIDGYFDDVDQAKYKQVIKDIRPY
jgi:hypothetical protein